MYLYTEIHRNMIKKVSEVLAKLLGIKKQMSQPKPPMFKSGGIVSEIKPNINHEPLVPFIHRSSVIHPELLETLKAANPSKTIIGYSNENGTIAVHMKPKTEVDFGKFVCPSIDIDQQFKESTDSLLKAAGITNKKEFLDCLANRRKVDRKF